MTSQKKKIYSFEAAHKILNEVDSSGGEKLDGDIREIISLIEKSTHNDRALVGIDIYKYSTLNYPAQPLVPFLFELLYKETNKNCKEREEWLFSYMKTDFSEWFTSTGDGGFQLFTTPLHALIFIIYFEANLRCYNAGIFYPKLKEAIGHISLRYSISYDKITKYNNNIFGPAIINNARILSRDKLNRLLIDSKSYNWFIENLNGIETLPQLNLDEISKCGRFSAYNKKPLSGTVIGTEENAFIHISASRLDDLKIKEQIISVYNIYIQAKLTVDHMKESLGFSKIVVAVGSPNATGIES